MSMIISIGIAQKNVGNQLSAMTDCIEWWLFSAGRLGSANLISYGFHPTAIE